MVILELLDYYERNDGKGLLGYQSEGFIFLGGYQIQGMVPLVIQASQLVPKYQDLVSARA